MIIDLDKKRFSAIQPIYFFQQIKLHNCDLRITLNQHKRPFPIASARGLERLIEGAQFWDGNHYETDVVSWKPGACVCLLVIFWRFQSRSGTSSCLHKHNKCFLRFVLLEELLTWKTILSYY
jgi:hypothetical protein